MNVVGYTCLHYGKDYLAYAIRSIIEHVDSYYVLYTPVGSHSHRTSIPCPETRDELHAIAKQAAGDKLVWIDGDWTSEGQQRDEIFRLAPEADCILVLDADEVWPDGLAQMAIQQTRQYRVKRWKVPMDHYWRSFYRAVTDDDDMPVRVLNPKASEDKEFFLDTRRFTPDSTRSTELKIAHFGYAQRPEIVAYKWLVHGHKNELRTDCDWFNDVFMANRQQDCHPVEAGHWNPVAVDPWLTLPEFMQDHPFSACEVIE